MCCLCCCRSTERRFAMSSAEGLREFIFERLAAAAEEILGVFQQTIVEYEEEINRQRKLLDVVWKPEIKLHRIELPQQHVFEEEDVPADQVRSSSVDKEEPEPPQIKEEQEELCSSQEGEQLVLKQEADTFMLTPVYEEDEHREDQNLDWNPDETLEDSAVKMPVINSVVSESNINPYLLTTNSHVAESQDQKGGKHEDSTIDGDAQQNNLQHNQKSRTNQVHIPNILKSHCNTPTGQTPFTCDTCGKDFKSKSDFEKHLRIHTDEKPHLCKICGKRLRDASALKIHERLHTGEKAYACEICGKVFRRHSNLSVHNRRVHTGDKTHICQTCGRACHVKSALLTHMRIHTGEKPFTCKLCGRAFRYSNEIPVHIRRAHTGEKPYLCNTCGKGFANSGALSVHVRMHTGEKPFPCQTCGKAFRYSCDLTVHTRRAHTGERPYLCNICGKTFFGMSDLSRHKRSHTS